MGAPWFHSTACPSIFPTATWSSSPSAATTCPPGTIPSPFRPASITTRQHAAPRRPCTLALATAGGQAVGCPLARPGARRASERWRQPLLRLPDLGGGTVTESGQVTDHLLDLAWGREGQRRRGSSRTKNKKP